MKLRYLSAAALDQTLSMSAAIDAMERVFRDTAQAVTPERVFMRQPRPGEDIDAWLGAMPGGWTGHGFGAKVVSLVADNPAAGRAAIQGIAVLLDPQTGAPVLLTDAAMLTTRRTAAMAGLATRCLAREDARRLAVVGTGALAADMIAAVRAVRAIESTVVYNRTRAKAEQLAARLAGSVTVADSADLAVAEADIVVLCTTSREPVVSDDAIRAGTHLNAVGNFSPQGSELELATVGRAEIWVDTVAGALAEAGEIIQAADRGLIAAGESGIRGDLAKLAGSATPRRSTPDAITLYKSVGTALADIGAMVAAAEIAAGNECGTLLE